MNQNQETSYDLVLQANGQDYNFITDDGIVYNAAFRTADELFPNQPFANHVLLFGIRPVEEKATLPTGIDPRISPTVAEILQRKFDQDKHLIVLYVCANEDKKELVRLRKFDQYYNTHNKDETFTKTKISDLETKIHGGVIYESNNPDAAAISTAALEIPSLFM